MTIDEVAAIVRPHNDRILAEARAKRLHNALANLVGVMRSGPDQYLNDPMVNSALKIAELALSE